MAAADLNLDGLCVPIPAIWYGNASAVCTPNGGLAYVAMSANRCSYIPPKQDGCVSNIQLLQTPKPVKAVDCDPDWSQTQHLFTMDIENIVYMWDMRQQLITISCRAHAKQASRQKNRHDGTMCVLRTRRVLSNVNNMFVLWCTVDNSYTTFGVNAMFDRDPIVLMRGSPYDDHLVAVGTKSGLVVIIDLDAKCIVHRLRGHDKAITSLEWMQVGQAMPPKPAAPPARRVLKATSVTAAAQAAAEAKLRGKLKPIVESDDVFDIFDFDDAVDQFGVVSQPTFGTAAQHEAELERLRMLSVDEKAVSNDHFDFVEACQSLKEEILQTNEAENRPDSEDSITSDFEKLGLSPVAASNVDDMQVGVMVNSSDESFMNVVVQELVENVPKEEEKENEEEVLSAAEKSLNAESVPEPELPAAANAATATGKVIYLASGAAEPVVWLWNTATGISTQTIELERVGKKFAPIPSIQTTTCWLDEHTILINTPAGRVVSYDVQTADNEITFKLHGDQPYAQKMVTALFKGASSTGLSIFWSKSVSNELVCSSTGGALPTVLQHFCAAFTPQMAIRESPHDPTVVAIGGIGRRINLLNLSSLRTDNIQLTGFTNHVQAKVLYLSWHPEDENQLAFSTEEGRVGIYDVSKTSNVPKVVNQFTSSAVYQLAWAKVNASRWVLFACAKGKLVYILEDKGKKKVPALNAITVLENCEIMSIGACAQYLAFGSGDGYVMVYTPQLNDDKLVTELWRRKLSARYISECTFSPVQMTRLAVATSTEGIHVFECCGNGEPLLVNELIGHEGVTMARWSAEHPDRLVSSGFDGTVRVWDVVSGQCTAMMQFGSVMCSALFAPTDENYVLAVGMSEMVRVFDVRKHANVKPPKGGMKAVAKKTSFSESYQNARAVQTDATVLAANERKRNKVSRGASRAEAQAPENSNASISEFVDKENGDVAVIDEPVQSCSKGHSHRSSAKGVAVQSFNYSTVFHLTSKEFNKDVITLLQQQITGEPAERRLLNARLFGSRDDVRDLLQIELNNHRHSNTESIAHILIPQLSGELEKEINDCIARKLLTERHLAMAPTVSYKFWSNCCKAYIQQMLELGAPLLALPYMMAVQDIDEAIAVLCKSHYYLEAWIVAKINHNEHHMVFPRISDKWSAHLESKGNLYGAALVAASDHPALALPFLRRHRNNSPEIELLVEKLESLVAS